MSELLLYDRLKFFVHNLISLLESQCPDSALKIRAILSELAFDACTYIDSLLGTHAHRSWLIEPTKTKAEKLARLRNWILLLMPLKNGANSEKLRNILEQGILHASWDSLWLQLALNLCEGYLGEYAALYCLISNDYEVLPLTFVQWSSEGYPPGDIIVIRSSPKKRFQISKCPVFLEITFGNIKQKIKSEKQWRKRYKQYNIIQKYFGKIVVNEKKVKLTIYDLAGEVIEELTATL